MFVFNLLVMAVFPLSVYGFECGEDETVCETSLIVEQHMTMRHPLHKKVYAFGGKIYKYDVTNTSAATPIPPDEVITADGWEEERLLIVANGSLPGPPITVYEGQRLIVHVINKLHSDSVSIHWHGLPLHGTPWMDGVAFVTQCPILPGQKFTYDFVAQPKGTYWYHSHIGAQRTKGLYGALIVRDRNSSLPEHNMVIQGWNHQWSADMDILKYRTGGIYENRKKRKNSFLLDGDFFGGVLLTSALINGRGRYYTHGEHNGSPLTVFNVRQGVTYRFRVTNADILHPFRVSVDNHNISVMATDGYDIQPVPVESFSLHSGERYDFIFTADQPVGNYWIRADSFEVEVDRLHRADAILRYEGAPEVDPISEKSTCSANSRCLVINCPFKLYPADAYTDCMPVDQLKSLSDNDPAPEAPAGQLKEYFMNFAFPGVNGYSFGSVNGRQLKLPPVSALTQPREIESTCDNSDCGEGKECSCTHSLSLDHDDVVQLVLTNNGKAVGGFHPVHLHGHSFYVLKIGYGEYNSTTGKYINQNTADIDCRGTGDYTTSFCNAAAWRNQSWAGGNIPGIDLSRPPRKDTVFVPAGGYVVIRIRVDNPGLWIIHCHMEVHSAEGMAMLINSSFDRIPPPPKHFPVCHDFPPTYREEPAPAPPCSTQSPQPSLQGDGYTMKTFWVTVAVLVIIILLMAAYILHLRKAVESTEKSEKYREDQAHGNPSFVAT